MSWLRTLVLPLAFLLLVPAMPSAFAEDEPGIAERVARTKARLADLRAAADRARERGNLDQAIVIERAANAYAEQLERLVHQQRQGERTKRKRHAEGREREHGHERPDAHRRPHGEHREGPRPPRGPRPEIEMRHQHEMNVLREALRILRERDAPERVKHGVMEVLERIARKAHHDAVHQRPEQGRMQHPAEHLRRRAVALRMAVPVLAEAGHAKYAALVERAILATELHAAGRRDPEAREAMARAPRPGELAEVLHLAWRIAREQGDEERAERILALHHEERARYQHEREQHEREMHEREMHEREQHEREQHERERRAAPPAHEIEALTRELHEMRARLEALQRHLEELRRR